MMVIDNVDPAIDYRRVRELSYEFKQHWQHLQAFYLDAIAGFAYVRESVEKEQIKAREFVAGSELDSEDFQNTRMFTYDMIFSKAICTSGIHQATQGQVKQRNAPNGQNFTTLGQLCIVSFFDFWDDYLRPEYCIAIGRLDRGAKLSAEAKNKILRQHAKNDLWGDLGYIRNAIVHNRGIATENMEKCKHIRWFKRGNIILLTPEHMRDIFMALLVFRNGLDAEQFPKHMFRIDDCDSDEQEIT